MYGCSPSTGWTQQRAFGDSISLASIQVATRRVRRKFRANSKTAYESMKNQNRRAFIAGSAALTVASIANAKTDTKHSVPKLVHHVFFWLKYPDSEADKKQLLDGLKTLGDIPTVRGIHIGIPASTEKREVVDNSFDASEILYFDDVEGQNVYQVHPIHEAFVENCSHLWDKVIVYDSVSV